MFSNWYLYNNRMFKWSQVEKIKLNQEITYTYKCLKGWEDECLWLIIDNSINEAKRKEIKNNKNNSWNEILEDIRF